MEMEDIQKIYRHRGMALTDHARQRMEERGISLEEVRDAIFYGEIIETRYDAEPRPRYLVLNYEHGGRALHVVLSVDITAVDVVTAYYPDPMKWDSTFRYRRG